MRSWHLVPKITYSVQKFSKHSCVLGLQFKQTIKAPGPLVYVSSLIGVGVGFLSNRYFMCNVRIIAKVCVFTHLYMKMKNTLSIQILQEARSRILYQISVERPMLKPVVFQFLLHES